MICIVLFINNNFGYSLLLGMLLGFPSAFVCNFNNNNRIISGTNAGSVRTHRTYTAPSPTCPLDKHPE